MIPGSASVYLGFRLDGLKASRDESVAVRRHASDDGYWLTR
jgi:hypothetical protein